MNNQGHLYGEVAICMELKTCNEVEAAVTLQRSHKAQGAGQSIGRYLFPSQAGIRQTIADVQQYAPSCGCRARATGSDLAARIAQRTNETIRREGILGRPSGTRVSYRYVGLITILIVTLIPILVLAAAAGIRFQGTLLYRRPDVTTGAASTLAVAMAVLMANLLLTRPGPLPSRDKRYFIVAILWGIFLIVVSNLLLVLQPHPRSVVILGIAGWVFLVGSTAFSGKVLGGSFGDSEGSP